MHESVSAFIKMAVHGNHADDLYLMKFYDKIMLNPTVSTSDQQFATYYLDHIVLGIDDAKMPTPLELEEIRDNIEENNKNM